MWQSRVKDQPTNNYVWLHFIHHNFSPLRELKVDFQTVSHDSSLLNESFSRSLTHTNHKWNYLGCRPSHANSAAACLTGVVGCNSTFYCCEFRIKWGTAGVISTSKQTSLCAVTNQCPFLGYFLLPTCYHLLLMLFFMFLTTAIKEYVPAFLTHKQTSYNSPLLPLWARVNPNFLLIPSHISPQSLPTPPSSPFSLVAREPEGLEVWITSHV